MDNEAYFKIMKDRPFIEKLREFGLSCENYVRNNYEASRIGISIDDMKYHKKESKAMNERVEFLFQELIKDYENVGGKVDESSSNKDICEGIK